MASGRQRCDAVARHACGFIAGLTAAAALVGCMSTGLHETARCAPPGRAVHTFAMRMGATLRDSVGLTGSTMGQYPFPEPLYALRLGLFRNCDIGFKAGLFAAGLSAKYTFRDGEPAVAFVADADGSFLLVMGAGATAGYRLSGRVLLSTEPNPYGYVASFGVARHGWGMGVDFGSSNERSVDITAAGGLQWDIGDRVRLMPSLTVDVPVWTRLTERGWDGDSTWQYNSPYVRRLSVSLGVSLGLLARSRGYYE